LQAIQFKHFDHQRKRLTVFLKGGKVRNLPLPEPQFWHDLERHIIEAEAAPNHYLMTSRWRNRYGSKDKPEQPMSGNGLHKWWYRCLANAGIVARARPAARRCTRPATPPARRCSMRPGTSRRSRSCSATSRSRRPPNYGRCDSGSGDPRGEQWWFNIDPDGEMGRLKREGEDGPGTPFHQVVEHEDGTITVCPSIQGRVIDSANVHGAGPITTKAGWHGWLQRGVWKSA
jgi:hypothetical protein